MTMDYKNPLYTAMKDALRRMWNADTEDVGMNERLASEADVATRAFSENHGHIWVLFSAPSDKDTWPNFSPVMVSHDEDKLKALAETMPGFHDKDGPTYQLFELPLDVMLMGEYQGVFQGLLGNFHHVHLQEEDD